MQSTRALERLSRRVRLRTLVILRWIAIVGQLAAIVVAEQVLGLALETGLLFLVVGASVIANLMAMFLFPETRRLTETETAAILLFDIAQLALLLALSGGLENPFALLILAPVTISATALRPGPTIVLGASAIALVTLVWQFHLPLRTRAGELLLLPDLFDFGFWLAIVIGIVFLAAYAGRVAAETRAMSEALLAMQAALDRERKLTDIGGVVAAAAHELGTPLATIKLTSGELVEELAGQPELQDDARLIRAQADRCRDILRSMGRTGKDDKHLRRAPLDAILQEAARPHLDRGGEIVIDTRPGEAALPDQPVLWRQPEIIYGLRNLIQNAVDFAESRVWVTGSWTGERITVRVVDDGPGYPAQVITRIGDPFVRSRRQQATDTGARPEYEGMGLGLFIAKTLLERTGATLTFANASAGPRGRPVPGEPRGAVVEVSWPRARIAVPAKAERAALGENRPLAD